MSTPRRDDLKGGGGESFEVYCFHATPLGIIMGVESGGTRPPQSKNQRGTSPHRNDDISVSFLDTYEPFVF